LEDWLWSSWTSRRHRTEILEFLGMRCLTRHDLADAFAFAADVLCPRAMTSGALMERLISWFFGRKIECQSEDELVRVTGGARRRFEEPALGAAGGLLPETDVPSRGSQVHMLPLIFCGSCSHSLRPVISEVDIWRAATLMLKRYGENAHRKRRAR
jgi:hypothetical protein